MSQIAQPAVAPRPYCRAFRLTFEYDGSIARLLSSVKVEMVLPPTDGLTNYSDQAGFWFVLSDAAGKPYYRKVQQNPMSSDHEVYSADPKYPSANRVPANRPKGVFVLLVPDIEQARVLVLFKTPTEPAAPDAAAKEFARFDLGTHQPTARRGE